MAKKNLTPEELQAKMDKKSNKCKLFFGTFTKALAVFLAIVVAWSLITISFSTPSVGTGSASNGASNNGGSTSTDDSFVSDDFGGDSGLTDDSTATDDCKEYCQCLCKCSKEKLALIGLFIHFCLKFFWS